MFKKLSLKFSVTAIAALFIIELLTVVLINGLNLYFTTAQVDETIELIIENNGSLPEKKDLPNDVQREDSKELRAAEERNHITRYFTAETNSEGKVIHIDTGHIASVTSEEAKDYAQQVIDSGKESGFFNRLNFRYLVSDNDKNSKFVVFYDFSSQSGIMFRMIQISAIISVILIVIFSVIICILSKRAVRPVMSNLQKQQQFITDAGHELKTPLAIIRADAEVISLTGGESEWTTSILNQTDRLSDLLGQMLKLAKAQESQRVSFERQNLSKILNDTAVDFSTYCNAQNKPLITHIPDGAYCNGDSKLLEMLFSTLLENAVKYGRADCEIDMNLSISSRSAKICITNFSDDPPTGDLKLLFDRFYRGDSSRTRETGGSGIGLSVAKSVTESHNGKISCEVEGDKVSFIVKLPLYK